jgi:hypothetical protein
MTHMARDIKGGSQTSVLSCEREQRSDKKVFICFRGLAKPGVLRVPNTRGHGQSDLTEVRRVSAVLGNNMRRRIGERKPPTE